MAGVDASPQSKTFIPDSIMVYMRVSFKASALNLESCPTEIRISVGSFPVFSLSQMIKPLVRALASSLPRVLGSPGTPSKDTPLISDPFCNFFSSKAMITPDRRLYMRLIFYNPKTPP